ncbi:hypothetical protein [Thermoflavimicrobium daqui]|jgi:hypothetical protein|uniref:Lipoprotein n=1 Tax=Thermoflavimicrobium daqui TaxID=2137476 RepID=A0A364K0P5_9BACL|nr:hypothetical protein [Thermoflavimicrobium daqui]RAL21077.1 hypothetical protein DL897_17075 [Thermoflavimicrobium daqui]
MKNVFKLSFPILWMLCIIGGCSNPNHAEAPFIHSSIDKEFPIPQHAKLAEGKANNPMIEKYAKYQLKNIGGEQGLYPSPEYLNEIKKWGWTKEDQMGHLHVFKKGKKIIWLTIEKDEFTLSKVKHLIDKNPNNAK